MKARLLKTATCAVLMSWALVARVFGAQAPVPEQPKVATLVPDDQTVTPGDLLRTTRIFPNWNLNCEVLLSQGRHLCAVELRSVDARGRQLFAWSIALATDGRPLMVLKIPSDVDRIYGLRMIIGTFTTLLTPRPEDCNPTECRIVAPFESGLRTLMASQQKIVFSLLREGTVWKIDAPLSGMSEALDMARRDPIGLIATQRLASRPPLRLNTIGSHKPAKTASNMKPERAVR